MTLFPLDLANGIDTWLDLLASLAIGIPAGAIAQKRLSVLLKKGGADEAGAEADKAAAKADRTIVDGLREEITRLIDRNISLEDKLRRAQEEVVAIRDDMASLRQVVASLKGFIEWYKMQPLCRNCPLREAEEWRVDTFVGEIEHPVRDARRHHTDSEGGEE